MYTFDENIARLEEAKNNIKAAIEEKGVVVGNGLINTYANKIKMIKTAGKTQAKTETITENNSTVSITADDGYILDKVVVKTEIPIGSKSVEYNRNGNYTITPEEGVEGYDNINVNVDIPIQESKDIAINRNGHYDVTPDVDNLGIAKVRIDVDIPMQEKNVDVTSSGKLTILPDNGYEGLNLVNLNVNVKADGKTVLPNGICLSGSTWETFDTTQYDWSKIRDMSYMFCNCSNLTSLDLSSWDTSNVTDMKYMFNNCSKLTEIGDLSNWDTSKVTSMNYMFDGCFILTSIGDLSNWDTGKVTNMNNMFNYCSNLTSLDISNWDTSNVTDMSNMFRDCNNLTEVKMGGDVSNVKYVSNMFNRITTTGTFYYNPQYDYSKIIAVLPSTWTAVPL